MIPKEQIIKEYIANDFKNTDKNIYYPTNSVNKLGNSRENKIESLKIEFFKNIEQVNQQLYE